MDAKWQAVFFIAAVVLFLLDAFSYPRRIQGSRLPLFLPLGLACAFIPFAWNAAEAGWG